MTDSTVWFHADANLQEGEELVLVGQGAMLGEWSPESALSLEFRQEQWTGMAILPIGVTTEFKFMIRGKNGEPRWEDPPGGSNRRVTPEGTREVKAMPHSASQPGAEQAAGPTTPLSHASSPFIDMERSGESFPMDDEDEPTFYEPVIMVSYQLPVIVSRKNGDWFVSWDEDTLLAPKRRPANDRVTWIGTLPEEIPEEAQPVVRALLKEMQCIPIFLDPEMSKSHYEGFCKDTLWSVMHNVVGAYMELPTKWLKHDRQKSRWIAYRAVNRIFADTVAAHCDNEDALVWLHGYELLMCPEILARRRLRVGLFLDTPFPSSEVFRTLSCCQPLLSAMLCASFIGFHCYEYSRHFISACRTVLRTTTEIIAGAQQLIRYKDRSIVIAALHAGIEPTWIDEMMLQEGVSQYCAQLKQEYAGKIIICGSQDSDHWGGMVLQVACVRRFLEMFPFWRDKVAFHQVGIGSPDITHLQKLQTAVRELNAEFGEVYHLHIATAACAGNHVRVPSPAERCGLDLKPLEFVHVQRGKPVPGVVLVSEFCSAHRVLPGAVWINPWNTYDVAESLDLALRMNDAHRQYLQGLSEQWVSTSTTAGWSQSILSSLAVCERSHPPRLEIRRWNELNSRNMVSEYIVARRRLIIVDYVGTLASAEEVEAMHRARDCNAIPWVKFLRALSHDRRNIVCVVSEEERSVLDKVFGEVPNVYLAAENGFCWRAPIDPDAIASGPRQPWNTLHEQEDWSWKEAVMNVMGLYTRATDGTYVVDKGSSVGWYHGGAERLFFTAQAEELIDFLKRYLVTRNVQVVHGADYVEVRPAGINKGAVLERLLSNLGDTRSKVQFVMCVGDDTSDEAMYRAVEQAFGDQSMFFSGPLDGCSSSRMSVSAAASAAPPMRKLVRASSVGADNRWVVHTPSGERASLFTITVGMKCCTDARYYVHDKQQVCDLLQQLAVWSRQAKNSKSLVEVMPRRTRTRSLAHPYPWLSVETSSPVPPPPLQSKPKSFEDFLDQSLPPEL